MNALLEELKQLLIETLDLEDIEPQDIDSHAPLFVEGLGLDSIDALELGVAIQKRYGLREAHLMTQTSDMVTREDIFAFIKHIFVEEFEIEAQTISLEAELNGDLDIDSIDAVDLMVSLKNRTGKKLDPDIFKQVRTVGDVVDAIFDLVNDRHPR